MKSNHILFDLDGTLIDSAPSILECYRLALAQFSIEPKLPLESNLIGPPLEATLQLISHSKDEKLIEDLAFSFKAHYDSTGVNQSVAYPGAYELLRDLQEQGQKLYIVTNKRISVTRKILNSLNWATFFDGVYSQDAFNPALPSKSAVIDKVLSKHHILKSEAYYVGDRSEDGKAAHANGLRFIWVTWGYGIPDATGNRLFDFETADSPSQLNSIFQ